MWQPTSHGSRSHYPRSPGEGLALIVFGKALTCFLMWFGEWLTCRPLWKAHMTAQSTCFFFHLLLPKTEPTTNHSVLFPPSCSPSLSPSLSFFLVFLDLCFHLLHLSDDTFVELHQSQGHRKITHACCGIHVFFFFSPTWEWQRVISLTLICRWIKPLLIQQSFPSSPLWWWGHACGLIVTEAALTAIDWKQCLFHSLQGNVWNNELTHTQVRTQPERGTDFNNWLNYKSDYVSSRLVW